MPKYDIEKINLGVSPITDNVYIGKINEEKGCFVGKKKDITVQFHNALVTLYGNYETIISNGEKYFHLEMKEITEEEAKETGLIKPKEESVNE